MSIVALSLPLVCAATLPPAVGRFAAPPLARDSGDWQRLDQKLPLDHLARQIDRAVAQLDLSALFASYAGTGSQAHRPDLLLKLVLFEVERKRHSPAQWVEDLLENEACQWLTRGLRPARSRLYAFRDRLGPHLERWHEQVIGLAMALDLTQASQASLDGSTVAANASRSHLQNDEILGKRQAALAETVQAETVQAETVQAEAPDGGPTKRPGWMAITPAGRANQKRRYQKAQERLTQRHAENRKRPASKRLAAKNVRVSPSDPEAALGQDKLKTYRPLYNVQLMPDLNSRLFLAYGVFAQATDAGTLPPMLMRYHAATGRYPDDLLADASYATALDLAACAAARVTLYAPYQENDKSAAQRVQKPAKQIPKSAFAWQEAEQIYVCPQGQRLHQEYSEVVRRKGEERLRVFTYRCPPEHCRVCPRQQECARSPERGRTIKRSEHEELVETLQARMQTEPAKTLYRRRGQTVELGFADIKEHRGLRRFSGRGLVRARIEVGLVVLVHNVLEVLAAREKKDETVSGATPEVSSA